MMHRPPMIDIQARGDLSSFPPEAALARWSAGIRAADDSSNNVISILDVIGQDYWTGGGVTAKRIAGALRAIGDKDVVVDINSPGGDMFEGIAIYNMLRAHKGRVTVRVLGMAASAASIIAMAGDDIEIGAASFFMIHNCWVLASGNRNDLAAMAEYLRPFDDAMAGVYAARSGKGLDEITAWMDAERWIGGSEAVSLGFASDLLEADKITEDEAETERARGVLSLRSVERSLSRLMPRSAVADLMAGVRDHYAQNSGMREAAKNDTREAVDLSGLEAAISKNLKII